MNDLLVLYFDQNKQQNIWRIEGNFEDIMYLEDRGENPIMFIFKADKSIVQEYRDFRKKVKTMA